MAVITTAPSERTVMGPLVMRSYTLTVVGNGDTLDVPLIRVLAVAVFPTTNTAVGATITQPSANSNRLTFSVTGTPSFTIAVWGREG
jgi:hypothetical protein